MSDPIQKEIEKAEELLRMLENFDVPKTIKIGAKEKWEAKLDDREIGIANIAYPAAQQAIDRSRAIKIDDVLLELRRMEDEMITIDVTGPVALVADALISSYRLYLQIGNAMFKISRALVNDPASVVRVLWEIASNFLVIGSALEIKKKLKAVFVLRDRYEAILRDAALPQRLVARHRRKKRTRDH